MGRPTPINGAGLGLGLGVGGAPSAGSNVPNTRTTKLADANMQQSNRIARNITRLLPPNQAMYAHSSTIIHIIFPNTAHVLGMYGAPATRAADALIT
jgi:hypothetical protein